MENNFLAREFKLNLADNFFRKAWLLLASANIHIVLTYRFGNFIHKSPLILKVILFPLYRLLNFVFSSKKGVEIPYACKIGEGFRLVHPFDIVITPQAVIGRNVVVFNNVTIGVNHFDRSGYPVVGDNVIIYTGAKIIGNVKIGHDCIIGANAVVVQDIPDHSVAGGIPARVIKTSSELPDPIWSE